MVQVHHPSHHGHHGSAGCRLEIIHMKILEKNAVLLKFDLVMFLLASVAYGLYLVLTTVSAYLLRKNGQQYPARRITAIYMGAMATLTFVWYITSSVGILDCVSGVKVTNVAPVTVTARMFGMMQFLLSDVILLYRTYMVYSRSWKVILLPGTVYLASAVLGLLVQLAPFVPGFHIQLYLNVAFMCTTIVYNAYCGFALVRKLSFFTRLTGRRPRGPITNVETRARLVQWLVIGSTIVYILAGVLPLAIPHHNRVSSMLGLLFQIMSFLAPAIFIACMALEFTFKRIVCTCTQHAGLLSSAGVSEEKLICSDRDI